MSYGDIPREKLKKLIEVRLGREFKKGEYDRVAGELRRIYEGLGKASEIQIEGRESPSILKLQRRAKP